MPTTDDAFAPSYAQAREKFLAAAAGLTLQSHPCPGAGHDGEALSMDVARLGADDARRVLMITSGCHGVEGFCGSGVQVALLGNARFRERARDAGVAVVMVHALNPWGFSHWRRVTHEGVDLNRNFVDFARPLPVNAGYAQIAGVLMPETWPPTRAEEARLAEFGAAHGDKALHEAVSGGQYQYPNGLFYGGTAPTWSHRTLRRVLWQHAARAGRLGWIDLHTGLGPSGTGERIFAARDDDRTLQRAKGWWGPHVTSLYDGSSSSPNLSGMMWTAAYEECPHAEYTGIALEFGSESLDETLQALRADHWAAAHPECPPELQRAVRARMRRAFFTDTPAWKQAILAQGLQAAEQAVTGLAEGP